LDSKKPVAYLATPYSHAQWEVKEQRFHLTTLTAYYLFNQGKLVYSPITHNVPIDNLGILGDWKVWSDFDHSMLSRCDQLLILKLEGWKESKGIAAERAYAQAHGIPIEEMDIPQEVWQWYQSKNLFLLRYQSVKVLSHRIKSMIEERNWGHKGTPKNYVMSLAAEVGELMAHFRWLTEEESGNLSEQTLATVREEIGDVFINLVCLCDTLKIDVLEAGLKKLDEIRRKYPVDQRS
jgi:NTP pyrophosphatase (non-canonical NTP hydrolase)